MEIVNNTRQHLLLTCTILSILLTLLHSDEAVSVRFHPVYGYSQHNIITQVQVSLVQDFQLAVHSSVYLSMDVSLIVNQ